MIVAYSWNGKKHYLKSLNFIPPENGVVANKRLLKGFLHRISFASFFDMLYKGVRKLFKTFLQFFKNKTMHIFSKLKMY